MKLSVLGKMIIVPLVCVAPLASNGFVGVIDTQSEKHMDKVIHVLRSSYPNVKVKACSFTDSNGKYVRIKYHKCLYKFAIDDTIKVINLSLYGCEYNPIEKGLIQLALNNGKEVVVASGNVANSTCVHGYPALYGRTLKRLRIVSSTHKGAIKGDYVTDYRPFVHRYNGTNIEGTSFSAPMVSADIMKRLEE
jgi:hypothetical protein